PQRAAEGRPSVRGSGLPDGVRPVPDLGLARARDDGDVRDPVRGAPPAGEAAALGAVRGSPAPEGLPPDEPRGQALAGRGRGRGRRGRVILAQTSAVDTTFSNYWLALVIKALAVLIIFLVVPLAVGYMEHKVLAHMQARLGPMEAGKFHGWAQLMADGAKFIQKEDVIPSAADRTVFSIAPGVALVPYLVVLVVIPLRGDIFALHL